MLGNDDRIHLCRKTEKLKYFMEKTSHFYILKRLEPLWPGLYGSLIDTYLPMSAINASFLALKVGVQFLSYGEIYNYL